MKYLCLIYNEEQARETMLKEDGDQMRADYFAFTDDIRKSGHYPRPTSSERPAPFFTARSG
ncbi:MAG TPA: hypothetical protein VH163_07020 [Gemmatimonadales bacterium]|jgi:hypothetical protein|nr:hypothetical protein [Gemmatimonadales bacterium]